MRYLILRILFELLALFRVGTILRTFSRCRGVILTLHRVLPDRPADFAPNAILQVTPNFLETVITEARKAGFDIVTLDEALDRLRSDSEARPFVVLTFDDAYTDNLVHALPILRKHDAPFTLYVPTALVDGVGEVWWQALEDIIAGQTAIAVDLGEGITYLQCTSQAGKREAFAQIYAHMRHMPEIDRVAMIRDLALRYDLDLEAHCRDLIMDWDKLRTFADEPLCTLGAHTVHHYELAKLRETDMRNEIGQSMNVLRAQFGWAPEHFSYPIGGPVSAGSREFEAVREFGLKSGVTTQPGGLYRQNALMPQALPRISLNGRFQARRFVDIFLTGAIFKVMNRGRVLPIARNLRS